MIKQTKWMAGAAAIAMMATAQAGYAAKKPSDGTSAPAAPVVVQDSRYDELAARVEALEQELQGAEIRAQADHAKVAAWKPTTGWWDNTSIDGRMYYNVSYVSSDRDGTDGTGDGVSFEIKRFYVGINHKFDSVFSANVTTDFLYDSTASATQIYIKKAYLQAKLDDAFTVRLGSTDMPWIPFAEGVYGYRYVENTVSDRTKFGTSADWGVHVMGKLYGGLLNYQFSLVNGAGYKKTVRTDGIDFEGRINLDYHGFIVGVGGYVGKLGVQHGTTTYNTAKRFNALVGYKDKTMRFGVEYFAASNYGSSYITSSTESHAEGVSVFGSYKLAPKWEAFARYDYVHPNSEGTKRWTENNYYNIGITYSPTKIVDFSLVYKHDSAENGYIKDSNGTIGGSSYGLGHEGAYDEFGLFGRLRW